MEGPGDHARILSAAVHSEIPAQKVLAAIVLEAVLSCSDNKKGNIALKREKVILTFVASFSTLTLTQTKQKKTHTHN